MTNAKNLAVDARAELERGIEPAVDAILWHPLGAPVESVTVVRNGKHFGFYQGRVWPLGLAHKGYRAPAASPVPLDETVPLAKVLLRTQRFLPQTVSGWEFYGKLAELAQDWGQAADSYERAAGLAMGAKLRARLLKRSRSAAARA